MNIDRLRCLMPISIHRHPSIYKEASWNPAVTAIAAESGACLGLSQSRLRPKRTSCRNMQMHLLATAVGEGPATDGHRIERQWWVRNAEGSAMKKAIKVLAVTAAVWGVTGVGVAQATQSGASASHQHGVSSLMARPMDTGWGPV